MVISSRMSVDRSREEHIGRRYLLPALMVAGLTAFLIPARGEVNPTTISLGFLLSVLLSATLFGSGPALLASLLAAASFNFFFLPPYYALTIDEPQNWVALLVFLIVAVTVGQLSAKSKQRAEV